MQANATAHSATTLATTLAPPGTPEFVTHIGDVLASLTTTTLYQKNSHIQELVQMKGDPFVWMRACGSDEIKPRAAANRLLYDWFISVLGPDTVAVLRERRTTCVADLPLVYAWYLELEAAAGDDADDRSTILETVIQRAGLPDPGDIDVVTADLRDIGAIQHHAQPHVLWKDTGDATTARYPVHLNVDVPLAPDASAVDTLDPKLKDGLALLRCLTLHPAGSQVDQKTASESLINRTYSLRASGPLPKGCSFLAIEREVSELRRAFEIVDPSFLKAYDWVAHTTARLPAAYATVKGYTALHSMATNGSGTLSLAAVFQYLRTLHDQEPSLPAISADTAVHDAALMAKSRGNQAASLLPRSSLRGRTCCYYFGHNLPCPFELANGSCTRPHDASLKIGNEPRVSDKLYEKAGIPRGKRSGKPGTAPKAAKATTGNVASITPTADDDDDADSADSDTGQHTGAHAAASPGLADVLAAIVAVKDSLASTEGRLASIESRQGTLEQVLSEGGF